MAVRGSGINHIQTEEHFQKHNANISLPGVQQRRFIVRILREPTFRNGHRKNWIDVSRADGYYLKGCPAELDHLGLGRVFLDASPMLCAVIPQ